MTALKDTLSRHGVLAADASTGPKPLTGPIWMAVKMGDIVRVEGDSDIEDGEYPVVQIDSDIGRNKDYAEMRVGTSAGREIAIYNRAVKGIVKRNNRKFTLTQAMVDKAAGLTPLWETIKPGDTVRVKGDSIISDGTYEVGSTDSDIFNGPDAKGVYIRDHGYVYNKSVKNIISPSSSADTDLWKQVEVGDMIEVTAQEGRDFDGYDIERDAGVFEVKSIDASSSEDHRGLRLRVEGGLIPVSRLVRIVKEDTVPSIEPAYLRAKIGDMVKVKGSGGIEDGDYPVMNIDEGDSMRLKVDDNDGGYWVNNDYIVAIVEPKPASSSEPAYKRAKVGDRVVVLKGVDHSAGTFEVANVNARIGASHRVAVKYNDYRSWWIENEMIHSIVGDPTSAPANTPVRGNFLIHVDVPSIMSNRSKGEHKPVVVTRRLSEVSSPLFSRELAWDGPSRFVHHEFMKIEGTDIQNWVETDAPITCHRDLSGIEVMTSGEGQSVVPMTKPILGGFVIHIAAPRLMANRQNGTNDPVIAVRSAFTNWATDVVFARRVEWNGPTRMVHRPSTPIPGTEGRGVSFLETDADVTVYLDEGPVVLRMPARKAAA